LTLHIILMGPQGSGKGTQSARVRSRLNLASIATGELFRAAIKHETALGQRIKAIYDRGDLVPDDLTIALVEERLDQIARERAAGVRLDGALYDGFPRTEAQARALDEALARRGESVSVVIAIDVPRDTLLERLAGRRVCTGCGHVYNVISDPPRQEGVCDLCGGKVVQRADDTPEAVAKRLDLYEVETAPLLGHYEDQGLLVRVDGDRPIEDVTEAIVDAVAARIPLASTRTR
jgi:adenylate kinase